MIKSLGFHVILDLFGCDNNIINNIDVLVDIFKNAIRIGDMNLIDYKVHKFKPYGVSGIFLISESHVSFHSQPEYNVITIDLYSCKDKFYCIKAIEYIKSKIPHKKDKVIGLLRGELDNE